MISETISHYRILRKLGEGGMGEVYLAEDTRLDRKVALKLLPAQSTKDENRLRRFQQEAKAASALNHPNILTIYEIGEIDSIHFIATEYVEGVELREHMRSTRMKIGEVLEIAVQVASALAAAHEAGIVHRDIKPENIMLRKDGYVKVLDFGLAKLTEPIVTDSEAPTLINTTPGLVMGTVRYMSPEQARGFEVDARTDIWSLGVVIYEMLTGHVPFEGPTTSDVMVSVLDREPMPLVQYSPEFPAELERIISKALRKDKEERYQTTKDLALDLKSLKQELEFEAKSGRLSQSGLSGVPRLTRSSAHLAAEVTKKLADQTTEVEAAHPTSSIEYLASEIKRHKRGAAALALGALVVLLVAALALKNFWGGAENGERIPVAVADFVNETKEEELNGLSGMLITSLEQSRRLAVLTRSRMFDVLKQLGKGDVDHIDETLGGEICKQANVKALVTASIRKFDQLYTIDLKVLDPQRNEYLFTAKEEGQGKASIPSMIDKLSEKTRAGLKEKATEIQATSQKVADTTTPNLEAYQHYFLGEQLINKFKFKEAEEEFKKALALDPTFALAYYRLAFATSWFGGEGAVKPMLKAMQYIGKAPEKERYLIRAYNAQIEEKRDEAIGIYKDLLKLYPEEKEALFAVGDLSVHKADHSTAITYFEKVLAIDPTFERALDHLIWTYQLLEQYDKALEYAKQYVAKVPGEEAYRVLGQVYILQGDFDNGLQTYRRALEAFPNSTMPIRGIGEIYIFKNEYEKAEAEFKKLLPEDRSLSSKRDGYRSLALLDAYLGKYREVIKTFDQIIELDLRLGDTGGLARSYVQKAYWLVASGHKGEEAQKAIDKGLELSNVADNRFQITLLYTYLMMAENEEAALIAKNQLAEYYPFDAVISGYSHRAKGEYDAAIKNFQTLTEHGLIEQKLVSWYDLAQCYFETGQNEKAIEAAQRMQKIYYNYYSNRAALYPRSFYLLGKTYEKKGEKRLATESYQKFLNLWKDADNDLPELLDAQARLAKLK